jgi:branched-chain amino acid transport system ATP-binding protein
MTVQENIEMGGFTISGKEKTVIKKRLAKVIELFPILGEKKKQKAGKLSSGEQQMLAVGRALMLEPRLLMLDEPSLGLSLNYVDIVFEKLKEINKAGTGILLVEQNASKALEICHRAYVFEIGTIALEGERETLLKNGRISDIYLG